MTSTEQIKKSLEQHCIAEIPSLYDRETLTGWNLVFDTILNQQDNPRKYVTAADFVKHNLLLDIFSPKLQSLIYEIMPSAELYHCHVYEINKQQKVSHIMGNNSLDGWHRDSDCKHDFQKAKVQHISLFVYLNDVSENGGCFEISTKQINYFPEFGNADTIYKLLGKAGTTFLFDRKAFHRASPNLSETTRRVLKLSFQTKHIYNHKRLLPAFKTVRDKLAPTDSFLRQLFGDRTLQQNELQSIKQTFLIANNLHKIDKNSTLPKHSFPAHFSLTQNFRRYIRDCLFVSRRLTKKLFPSLDNIPPKKDAARLIKEET